MWSKALVVVALLGGAGLSELGPMFSASLGAHCTDQVCFCPRHAASRPEAKGHCHDQQGQPSAEMSAACRHGETAAPAPATPRVLPAVVSLFLPSFVRFSAVPRIGDSAPGHLRHELPPPRSAA